MTNTTSVKTKILDWSRWWWNTNPISSKREQMKCHLRRVHVTYAVHICNLRRKISRCFGNGYLKTSTYDILSIPDDKSMQFNARSSIFFCINKADFLHDLSLEYFLCILKPLISYLKLKTIQKCFLCPYKRQSSMLCFTAFSFSRISVKSRCRESVPYGRLYYTNYQYITNTCACVESPHCFA